MRKICISFIILLIILSSTVFAETRNANGTMVKVGNTNKNIDWKTENQRREELYKETLDEWMKQYIGDEVLENQRVTGYQIHGWMAGEENDEIFTPVVYIKVDGISEDSIWDKNDNPIYLKFKIVDGDYIFESASMYPEKYDEFMVAFEEYEKNKETVVETTGVSAEASYVANENKIDELSNWIFITSALILSVSVLIILVMKVKKK